ncbi:MAG: serine hydrolase [Acidobacteriota bacterium]
MKQHSVLPERLSWAGLPAALVENGVATGAAVGLEIDERRVGAEVDDGAEALTLEVEAVPADPTAKATPRFFDLASLTKPFVATLALVLDESGELPLVTPVGSLWPHAHRQLRKRPLESLLRHSSGLKAWAPLYAPHFLLAEADDEGLGLTADRIAGFLGDRRQWGAEVGTYSDLGYLLYGLACRRVLGADLDLVLTTRVLEPLLAAHGAEGEVRAHPEPSEIVPTTLDTTREVQLAQDLGLEIEALGAPKAGQRQDGNARFLRPALGAVAGHAGLFGSVAGVLALGREWRSPGALLSPAAVSRALDGEHRLGWFRPRAGNSGGPDLPAQAFGHTGFTGGSLWVVPDGGPAEEPSGESGAKQKWRAGGAAVLLAHRTTPEQNLHPYRHQLHRQLLEQLAARGGER